MRCLPAARDEGKGDYKPSEGRASLEGAVMQRAREEVGPLDFGGGVRGYHVLAEVYDLGLLCTKVDTEYNSSHALPAFARVR